MCYISSGCISSSNVALDLRDKKYMEKTSLSLLLFLVFHSFAMVGRKEVECPYFIDDVGLIVVAKDNPNLISVDLSGCYHVTIDGLQILAKLCPQLQTIKLYNLPTYEGEGIEPYGDQVRIFESMYPRIQVLKKSPWQLAWEEKVRAHEEKVRRIQAAQREEEARRKKFIRDTIGDERIKKDDCF